MRIGASMSVTRCERGLRVRVIGWASGRVRSGLVRLGIRGLQSPGKVAEDLAERGWTSKERPSAATPAARDPRKLHRVLRRGEGLR